MTGHFPILTNPIIARPGMSAPSLSLDPTSSHLSLLIWVSYGVNYWPLFVSIAATPISDNASLTSSILNGLMIAVINLLFMHVAMMHIINQHTLFHYKLQLN